MNKAIFKYKKDANGAITERVILRPQMMKESSNFLNDFSNPDVKYIHGFEIDKTGLPEWEILKYEKLIEEFYSIESPKLEDFLKSKGLDPSKLKHKTFKKEGIQDLQLL